MNIDEIEKYVKTVIPNLEKKLSTTKDKSELVELYNLYKDILIMVAPYDFETFNKALEIEEDKSRRDRGFYHHRKHHIGEIFQAMNDMEIYDMYDYLFISTPSRIGKTTTGIRFLSWIMGRYPEETQLATSYSDSITQSFYNGVMEIVMSSMYKLIFPDAPLINQNAKRQEIWLKVRKRYPTITFAPIGGSVTGRAESSKYLYCDDLVSGIELALSPTRLDKLWQIYTDEFKQRKLDGAKEIHVATRWSIHDPITKLSILHEDNPRAKVIAIPCYGEDGESQFDYFGGFSTAYYKDLEDVMDELTFQAVFMCNPIEREGLLYHSEDLQYYFELPTDRPDTIISVADTKGVGKDYVASPIGYMYGDLVYIEDVVYNNGLPELTIPLLANKWVDNNVVRGDIEMNNGGDFYAKNVNDKIKELGGNTSVRTFFTSQNKDTKIITYADFVTKHFIFKDPSMYSPNSEYAKFMQGVFSWTQTGKNKWDDSVDSLAMLAQLVQDISRTSIKVLNRRDLGL
ncbi:MAG TPA: phage terminase large subunit [Tissierellaceae bacterium]|nr:phage terminase large subunit [Tissierellaceae bacterium]